MAAYDDLNVRRIAVVGVISIVVVAVTALAVQVIYYAMADWNDSAKQAASEYRRQNKVLADQATQISTVGVDPINGNITIPIQEAMMRRVQQAAAAETSNPDPSNAQPADSSESAKSPADRT